MTYSQHMEQGSGALAVEEEPLPIPVETLPTVNPRGFSDGALRPRRIAPELEKRQPAHPPAAWPEPLISLRNPQFRLFCGGNFLSNIGTWMQNIAQGWLVLQLTDSPFWLGFVGFVGAIPYLVFTLFGGVIADRVSKRYLLIGTQTAMMVLAFAMAALAYLKIITIRQLALLSFMNGVAMALNAPSYQAMVPQLVPRGDLPNAIALNSAQFNLSRVLGPTLGGYAMALFGVAGNFLLNAISFFAVLLALFRIRYPEPRYPGHGSVWRSLADGFRYVREHSVMFALVSLVASASLLLFPFLTFVPFFAKIVLHVGARGLGLLMACSGVGAFCAAGTIAWLGTVRHRGKVIVFSGVFVMAAVIVFCYSHSFALSAAMSFCEGYGLTMTSSTMNLALQQLTSDAMRGRVMSIYATSFMGFPPVGCLLAGELSRHMPTAHAIAAMTAVAMLSFLLFYWRSEPLRNLD